MKKLTVSVFLLLILSSLLFGEGAVERIEEEKARDYLASLPSSFSSPRVSIRHQGTLEGGEKVTAEYSSSFLSYAYSDGKKTIELYSDKEGTILLVDGREPRQEELSIVLEKLSQMESLLSSPSLFTTYEVMTYLGDGWKVETRRGNGDSTIFISVEFKAPFSERWKIEGHMDSRHLYTTATPTTLPFQPYFILDAVESEEGSAHPELW